MLTLIPRKSSRWSTRPFDGRTQSDVAEKVAKKVAKQYKVLYNLILMTPAKPVEFLGSSLDDLRNFPADARQDAGYQIHLVQTGADPDYWKPMTMIGSGVREIRITDSSGAFRVIYVAKFAEAVYVLHCFQKKTQRTAKQDLDLATRRYNDLARKLKP